MKTTVVTGWSPAGYLEYGRRFCDTWARYWPRDVRLVVYVEEPCELPPGARYELLQDVPGVMEFMHRWGGNLEARGRAVSPRWKASAIAAGYNWRFDAVKFFRQAFIPAHAARTLADDERGVLCWLDGDVVTHARVPDGWLPSLLPPSKAIAFLGRGDKHSEIGFQLYRTGMGDGPHLAAFALSLLVRWQYLYESGEFYREREWHSAYIWDIARRWAVAREYQHDLTPGGRGHVWHDSPLAAYTDHLKGDRKKHGRSPERRR